MFKSQRQFLKEMLALGVIGIIPAFLGVIFMLWLCVKLVEWLFFGFSSSAGQFG
ncbi:MAG: hypothetical protein JSS27_17055 [Planctomycetes bacterium]|nr:hypothetical protein [Planctomycetota bacterium]